MAPVHRITLEERFVLYWLKKKVKEIAKMLFINAGQIENKLDVKLKKQEIVFDTAVFHFELIFDNKVRSNSYQSFNISYSTSSCFL